LAVLRCAAACRLAGIDPDENFISSLIRIVDGEKKNRHSPTPLMQVNDFSHYKNIIHIVQCTHCGQRWPAMAIAVEKR